MFFLSLTAHSQRKRRYLTSRDTGSVANTKRYVTADNGFSGLLPCSGLSNPVVNATCCSFVTSQSVAGTAFCASTGAKGIIARFVPEITLSRVRLRSLGCADPHITCPINMAARFETVRSMETNKGTVRKPKTGRKLCLWHRPQSDG